MTNKFVRILIFAFVRRHIRYHNLFTKLLKSPFNSCEYLTVASPPPYSHLEAMVRKEKVAWKNVILI